MPTVYKICESSEWEAAERAGAFAGSAIDARDGFIHLSTAAQVADTAAKHFAGGRDLMLIALDGALLAGGLRWEPARGGELFPHFYGTLPLRAVLWAARLRPGPDGGYAFPELAP